MVSRACLYWASPTWVPVTIKNWEPEFVFHGVHFVALTGSGERASEMPVFAFDFIGDGVTRTAIAQLNIGGSAFGFWVATLHHEIFDHAVKQNTIIETLIDEFDEVFAVLLLFGIECQNHIAHRGFDRYPRPIVRGCTIAVIPAGGCIAFGLG